MKNRIAYVILAFVLMLNAVVVYADDISDLQNKLNETNKKQENLNEEIKENKKVMDDVNKQIKDLDSQITKVSTELEQVEAQLETLNNQIEVTKEELVKAEENILEKNSTLSSRLRVMYKNGNIGYLEVLLGSKDIKNFFSRLDMVQSIIDQDVDLLKYMKAQRDEIENKEMLLKAQQNSVFVTKQEIETKKNELQIASRAKLDMMSELKKDTKALEKQVDELNALADEISEQIRLSSRSGEYEGGDLMWPVPGHTRISSPFGYRIHPIFKTRKMHTGIDIPAPTGTAIKAAGNGVVTYSGWLGGYGNVVMIDHNGGITTLYAHNSSLVVKKGDYVNAGDTIAKAGSTGNSTGPHCHFEVRNNGKYEDPVPWVKGN